MNTDCELTTQDVDYLSGTSMHVGRIALFQDCQASVKEQKHDHKELPKINLKGNFKFLVHPIEMCNIKI